MAITKIPAIIRIRRGTIEQWNEANPILQEGEASYVIGNENTFNRMKIGDGITPWKLLPFIVADNSLPPGGEEGQVLVKLSDNDYDVGWTTIEVGGGDSYIIPKITNINFNRINSTEGFLSFTINKDITAYCLIQNFDMPQPLNYEVKNNGLLLGQYSIGTINNFSIQLTPGKKDIYIVIEDLTGYITLPFKITAEPISEAPIVGNTSNRELKSLFGVSTIPQLMQKLQIRCQEGDFTGLQNGDYVDGLSLNGLTIPATTSGLNPSSAVPQAWNDSTKNNCFEIVGINHYKNQNVYGTNLNGLTIGDTVNTKNHILFCFNKTIVQNSVMNTTNTNTGGYLASELKTWIDTQLTPKLEQQLGIQLYPLWKYHSKKGSSQWAQYKCWIPSEIEIFGSVTHGDELIDNSNNSSKKLNITSLLKQGYGSWSYYWTQTPYYDIGYVSVGNYWTAGDIILPNVTDSPSTNFNLGIAPVFSVSYPD